jgi:hypothetical protein
MKILELIFITRINKIFVPLYALYIFLGAFFLMQETGWTGYFPTDRTFLSALGYGLCIAGLFGFGVDIRSWFKK